MRRIPGPPEGLSRLYVPKAFDNHKEPEPVRVRILQPSEQGKRDCANAEAAPLVSIDKGGKVIEADGRMQMRVDLSGPIKRAQAAIRACVTSVENYASAAGVAITTGEQLATLGETEIIQEVGDEIRLGLGLSEAEKKSSTESTGSSPKETQASSGTASDASPSGSPSAGDAA